MKKSLLYLSVFVASLTNAQYVDTLAIQDFETAPATPTWNYTGTPNALISGFTGATATPANSPMGIGGSTAWHVEQVTGGNPLTFNNISIPAGYDSLRLTFKIAAMNHTSTSGGPDNLDYVLVELSTDGGNNYYGRLRVRGATSNDCSWAYDATAIAQVPHLPQTEAVFQPTTSGLQTTDGYSTVIIDFPGTVSDISTIITPRSSSASDDWMIDNIMLLGYTSCAATGSSQSVDICNGQSYFVQNAAQTTSGTYYDTLTNAAGCDSIITTTLNVTTLDSTVTAAGPDLTANAVGLSYQWLDCDNGLMPISGATNANYVASANGNYAVQVSDGTCLDTSACIAVIDVSTQQLDFSSLEIYPNPAKDQITIALANVQSGVTAKIVDVAGKLQSTHSIKNQNQIVDISQLASGIYFIEIVSNNTRITKRFYKE